MLQWAISRKPKFFFRVGSVLWMEPYETLGSSETTRETCLGRN